MLALVLCAPVVTAAASLQELAQRLFPQATVGAVEPTPIPNLYKVLVEGIEPSWVPRAGNSSDAYTDRPKATEAIVWAKRWQGTQGSRERGSRTRNISGRNSTTCRLSPRATRNRCTILLRVPVGLRQSSGSPGLVLLGDLGVDGGRLDAGVAELVRQGEDRAQGIGMVEAGLLLAPLGQGFIDARAVGVADDLVAGIVEGGQDVSLVMEASICRVRGRVIENACSPPDSVCVSRTLPGIDTPHRPPQGTGPDPS